MSYGHLPLLIRRTQKTRKTVRKTRKTPENPEYLENPDYPENPNTLKTPEYTGEPIYFYMIGKNAGPNQVLVNAFLPIM